MLRRWQTDEPEAFEVAKVAFLAFVSNGYGEGKCANDGDYDY